MADQKPQSQSLFTAEEYKESFAKNKKSKREEKIQLQVCTYLRNVHPELIWFCDLASGLKLPIWLGVLHSKMRSSRGLPDLFIPYPASKGTWGGSGGGQFDPADSKMYHGLFIEIKKDGIRLKNGEMPKTPHIKEQAEIIARLNRLGYSAQFGCGYEECIKIIEDYLK